VAIDAAQDAIAGSLASTGAVSSAMNFNADALGQQISGLDSGLHNLVDVDAAQESVALITAQIREQFAAAALAQANTLQLSMVRQLLMNS
jgi:flagellin-like hook-associated protein FlgL